MQWKTCLPVLAWPNQEQQQSALFKQLLLALVLPVALWLLLVQSKQLLGRLLPLHARLVECLQVNLPYRLQVALAQVQQDKQHRKWEQALVGK
jgi:hypothetical protein